MNEPLIVLAIAAITITTGLFFGWLSEKDPRP